MKKYHSQLQMIIILIISFSSNFKCIFIYKQKEIRYWWKLKVIESYSSQESFDIRYEMFLIKNFFVITLNWEHYHCIEIQSRWIYLKVIWISQKYPFNEFKGWVSTWHIFSMWHMCDICAYIYVAYVWYMCAMQCAYMCAYICAYKCLHIYMCIYVQLSGCYMKS